MNKITGIYLITSPSGRLYIGQSTDIYKRWNSYKNYNIKGQHKILNSLKKYTFENHYFEILIECNSEYLNKLERTIGDFFDVLNKDNLNLQLPGYDDIKLKVSDEVKNKISKALKGKSNINKSICQLGEKNHRFGKPGTMLGKKLSEESKLKISENMKGEKHHMFGKKGELCHNFNKLGKDANRVKIIINTVTGEEHYGVREVALILNINESTLKCWLNGSRPNKSVYEYKI